MALFPVFPTPTAPIASSQVLCRPTPAGGCIALNKYWRYTSNRLREYGPYDRLIDYAKLVTGLTYSQIVEPDRYAVAYKIPLMGVMEPPRFSFQDMVYPFQGVSCPAPAAS
jgi:hypothetical protein